MDSVLEVQRQLHEEIDTLEQLAVDELLLRPRTFKEKVAQEHQVNHFLQIQGTKSLELLHLYEDKDGTRKREIESLSGAAELSEFYRQLKEVKDYHRHNPNELVFNLKDKFKRTKLGGKRKKSFLTKEMQTLFTGEENFGKCIDLHMQYQQFLNLKQIKEKNSKLDYISYLSSLDKIKVVSKEGNEYLSYLNSLNGYFNDFLSRSKPLFSLKELLESIEQDFDKEWKYEANTDLFCVPCGRFFSKKTVFDAHLSGKKHIKASSSMTDDVDVEALRKNAQEGLKEKERKVVFLEYSIKRFVAELHEVIEETKSFIERKQSRTVEEREQDAEEEEELEIEEPQVEEEEELKLYNPKGLPLGWDGKPIPYWLYKLHGLGIEYPCEICGNFVYMGRKAFERHFSEWRHTYALKCLGVVNSKHFYEITRIEEALALWEKLNLQAKLDFFDPDVMEEYEDEDGNVYNKKTFEDLKRQGIL